MGLYRPACMRVCVITVIKFCVQLLCLFVRVCITRVCDMVLQSLLCMCVLVFTFLFLLTESDT